MILYDHSAQVLKDVSTSAEALFGYMDDPARIGSHMREPSMMMLGARMIYELDERRGRAAGSVIKLHGSLLGLPLVVEEVIVDRRPPHLKTWRTFGRTRLFVIGAHQVGFEITPAKGFCRLRIFINYNYPSSILGKLMGMVFGRAYVRWCLRQMSEDAAAKFQSSVVAP